MAGDRLYAADPAWLRRAKNPGSISTAQAGQVLRDRDVELAARVETMDSLMNDLQQELFAVMLSPSWSYGVAPAVDLSLLGRFYERYADHAVAVAQRVVFLVTGENVGAHSGSAGYPPSQ